MAAAVTGVISSLRWYAVWCRSRQEKSTAAMMDTLGIAHYLPLTTEHRQWSDRRQVVHLPLFAGYLFVRIHLQSKSSQKVLNLPGVVRLVGNQHGPLPIPDQQIAHLQRLLAQDSPCHVLPYVAEGDSVRVIRGALKGMEARLIRRNSQSSLVIPLEMINQSVAVNIASEDVVPLNQELSYPPVSSSSWALLSEMKAG